MRKTAHPLASALSRRGSVRSLAQHSLLPPSVWKRLPAQNPTTVRLSEEASFLYRGPFDRELCWRGLDWIEGATIRPFFALAERARVVVDVGANTGLYTLVACAASPDLDVVAFEPVGQNIDGLSANLAENGWRSRCDVREVAVSNVLGTTSFHVPFDEFPVSASLFEHGYRGIGGELVTVEVRTLDEELRDCPHVDLVKIDVEGFEHLVLEGMEEVLDRCSPAIVLECNPDGRIDAISEILASHGYTFLHLVDCGPVEIARIAPDPTEKFRNFLCLARNEDRALWMGGTV